MRRFLSRAVRRGRRLKLVLTVGLLAGLTSVVTVSSVPSSAAPSTSGYWLVGTDGGIFSYGKAGFYGSTGAIKLNQPIAGMAATPDGKGYWMVASDGGIFAFGDAPFLGSMGSAKLNKPIVDIIPTPSGRGYWMAASDGGIFAFGDAGFFGSTGAIKLTKRIQQMAATPTGKGYWMVAGDGGVFAFGDAAFYGSAADGSAEKRVVDIAPSATGKGYYITASNGAVYPYGDATDHGGISGKLSHGIIAMVTLTAGDPPIATNDTMIVDEDLSGVVDVLANDRDPDGSPMLQSAGIPLHGTATVENGRITYRPKANYNGTDTFSYTIVDTTGQTAVGLVSVTVRSVDDLPRAVNDVRTVGLGQTITIDVLGNDSGMGDGFLGLEVRKGPSKGSITKSPDGRAIVYTPSGKGKDTIEYRVTDADGDNALGVVDITVTGPKPTAVDVGPIDCSALTCTTDLAQAAGVSFGNGGQLSLVGEQGGSKTIDGGTFSRQGNVISFTATRGNVGSPSVEYQIVDADNDTAKATLRFNYQNSLPTANGADVTLGAGGTTLLTGQDPDGDQPLTYSLHSADPGVTATIGSDGTLQFFSAPTPGLWKVYFIVTDSSGAQSGVAEVRVNFTG